MPSCPEELELVRFGAADLTVSRTEEIRQHLAVCGDCRSKVAGHERILGLFQELNTGPAGLTASVLARLPTQPQRPRKRAPRLGWWAGFTLPLAALGCAALLALFVIPRAPTPVPAPEGEMRARGQNRPWTDLVRVEVLEVPAPGSGLGRTLEGGEQLSASSGYAFRYANGARGPVFLMAFGIDSQGEVHWLVPAWLDASTNPKALALPATEANRTLPQVAAPQAAAQGAFRLNVLLLREAWDVKSVEALLARGQLKREIMRSGDLRQLNISLQTSPR